MKVLLVNVHSARNLGDDGIMSATLHGVFAEFPNGQIVVAANDPLSWRKYASTNVRIVPSLTSWVFIHSTNGSRFSKTKTVLYMVRLLLAVVVYRLFNARNLFGTAEQKSLLQSYYEADLVLSCGGGNFYSHRLFSAALMWSIFSVGLAIGLKKPLVFLPQSFGPIQGVFEKFWLRFVLCRAKHILVRESHSLTFIRALGVRQTPVFVPDLAFTSSDDGRVPPPLWEPDEVAIGVTLMNRAQQLPRFKHQQAYENAILEALVQLNNNIHVQVFLFVQCYGPTPDQDDRLVTRHFYHRLQQCGIKTMLREDFDDSGSLRMAYRKMTCMLATRMHTAVFALTELVPVVLVAYQPKALGLMEAFGLQQFASRIEDVTADRLHSQLHLALSQQAYLRAHIQDRMVNTHKQIQHWTQYLRID